jgi:hypothetical protein
MSIISGNRNDRRAVRHHKFVNGTVVATLNDPRKRDLKAMLAEAVLNTAALPIEHGAGGYLAPPASASSVPLAHDADAFVSEGKQA